MKQSLSNWEKEIEKVLQSFPFVQWDRYTKDVGGTLNLYGWIAREDGRFDFIVITAFVDTKVCNWWWISSSSKYTHEIARILNQESDHTPCKRVEKKFTIKNMIVLKKPKKSVKKVYKTKKK